MHRRDNRSKERVTTDKEFEWTYLRWGHGPVSLSPDTLSSPPCYRNYEILRSTNAQNQVARQSSRRGSSRGNQRKLTSK
ncbi:unnamed protein product [Xylocopa violacea]|uniref:Uncharacterized protein n=1 Tax=Xylocopa violacea TaxID=135666 RepID=A0ABP1NBL6_XYLVO